MTFVRLLLFEIGADFAVVALATLDADVTAVADYNNALAFLAHVFVWQTVFRRAVRTRRQKGLGL